MHHTIPNHLFERFPFDLIRMTGNDAVDFLQRITTNDFSAFKPGDIQKTLIITEKGRMIDAVWAIHNSDHVMLLCSYRMADELIAWLKKFVIMEDIDLENASSRFHVDLHLEAEQMNGYSFRTEYYSVPAIFNLHESESRNIQIPDASFDEWRIQQGIPVSKKELVQDYNPLELNLWNWISFTKGCYIGQEVIARLDTYKKIQRSLCLIGSSDGIFEGEMIVDADHIEIGKITSVSNTFALAVLRSKFAIAGSRLTTAKSSAVDIHKVFLKEEYGRN